LREVVDDTVQARRASISGGETDGNVFDPVNGYRLTYRFQGRDFRLTDVQGKVVKKVFA
jgi:hypothetical protein